MVVSDKEFHIQLNKEDLCGAKYALMPGDPGRVEKIARHLENPRFLNSNREYTSYLGALCGENVIVMSHGIGGPSTAIAVEELAALGVKTFIRVGTSGGMQPDVLPGDIINVNGAIRAEGTSKEYVMVEYPAISDFKVTRAIYDTAVALGVRQHTGVVHCKDSFYGQHSPERMPVAKELEEKWNAFIKTGALASEMETATLFIVCSTLRVRAGAVMLCVWNQMRTQENYKDHGVFDTENAIRVAVEAMKRLIKDDKEEEGKSFLSLYLT